MLKLLGVVTLSIFDDLIKTVFAIFLLFLLTG
jgi:hypothetical protein